MNFESGKITKGNQQNSFIPVRVAAGHNPDHAALAIGDTVHFNFYNLARWIIPPLVANPDRQQKVATETRRLVYRRLIALRGLPGGAVSGIVLGRTRSGA